MRQRWIEAVVTEGERFGILAQELASGLTGVSGGLDVPVPWVADWRARDLIGHLGTVHRWATHIVRAGTTERPPPEATQTPPADENLLEWYETGLVELVATLRTTPPDAPAWHMSPTAERVAASWARRQAHELAVHRMDLEAAAGVAARTRSTPSSPRTASTSSSRSSCRAGRTPSRSVRATPTVGVTCTDTGRMLVGRASTAVRSRWPRSSSGTRGRPRAGRRRSAPAPPLGPPRGRRPSTATPAAEALLRGR